MVARKVSSKPTRIWKFGARPPVEGADVLRDAMYRSVRYYNKLIEIERERRVRFDAIRAKYAPELSVLETEFLSVAQEIEGVFQAVKKERQERFSFEGKKSLEDLPPEAKARVTALKQRLKDISARAKPLRAAFNKRLIGPDSEWKRRASASVANSSPTAKGVANSEVLSAMLGEDHDPAWKEIRVSDDLALVAKKQARRECGLSSGTYLKVEESVARAVKDSLPLLPRFKRGDGSGRLVVQTKLTFSQLCTWRGKSIQLKQRDGQYWTACFAVGGRTVSIPFKMHRTPPADADVKWVWLKVFKRGDRYVYELQFTLEHESFGTPKRPPGVGDGGHIQLGWSQRDDGVAVAKWSGGDVVVPRSILDQGEHADLIGGYADKHFNDVKRVLKLWVGGKNWHLLRGDFRRKRIAEACKAFAMYRFGNALRDLWAQWKTDRLAAGRDLFSWLRVASRWIRSRGYGAQEDRAAWWLYLWAMKERHMKGYALDSRRRFEARREAFFKAEAIRIATAVETVSVDSYSVAELKKLPDLVTSENRPNEKARYNLQLAAPGRFREVLLETMGSRCTVRERSVASAAE